MTADGEEFTNRGMVPARAPAGLRLLLGQPSAEQRRALAARIQAQGRVGEIATAATPEIALRKLLEGSPDVAVLDPGWELAMAPRVGKTPCVWWSEGDARKQPGQFRVAFDSAVHAAELRHSLAGRGPASADRTTCQLPHAPQSAARRRDRIELIVLGSSTGGPNALAELLPELPSDLPAPVLIVQHMPSGFTRSLAEDLDRRSSLHVKEAEQDEAVLPGTALLAPGGQHLEVVRRGTSLRTKLTDGPKENSCRPAVDVLLRSAVGAVGNRLLAVILTGMGEDGARGCRLVKQAGGRVCTQAAASCVVYGMPRAVDESGCSDQSVPLASLAAAIQLELGACHASHA